MKWGNKMQKIVAGFIMLLIGGCASHDSLELAAPISLQRNDVPKKEETYNKIVECPYSYYWSTQPFTPESLSCNAAEAKQVKVGPYRTGFDSRILDNAPSVDDFKMCSKIIKKMIHEPVEYEMLQLFDAQEVTEITRTDTNLHNINPQVAYLINTYYKKDPDTDQKIKHNIYIPITVKCDNSWKVKQSNKRPYLTVFQQPKGKCHFSSQDYKFEPSSSENITVVVEGYYELDPEYQGKNMIIKIEKYGFVRTP